MKEIKFRIWDKDRNSMSPVYSLAELLIDTYKQLPQEHGEGFFAKLIFLQYTGLLDKNGKEIYEQDIIKTPKGLKNNKRVYKNYRIERWFSDFIFQQSTGTEGKAGDLDEMASLILSIQYYLTDCDIEVIGNIYENPELLNQ